MSGGAGGGGVRTLTQFANRPPRQFTQYIHEGRYAAEVLVIYNYDSDWSPTMSVSDVEMLERVRLALRRGDIKAAAKEAKVYELLPLAGE